MLNKEDYVIEEGEYQGKPVFSIKKGEYVTVSFGLQKAKAIVTFMKEIEDFVGKLDPKFFEE